MRSEVDRYLGWPGQAISYKVGERVWLEARADAKRRKGAAFDLKEFHTLRARPRQHGPRPAARRARPVLVSAPWPTALDGFTETTFTLRRRRRATVYRAGTGPGVVVMSEMPGITPNVADVRAAGSSTPGSPSRCRRCSASRAARSSHRLHAEVDDRSGCVSREFTNWALNRTSPVIDWLRALARDLHEQCGGPGVGAIGMCFTGGFALAMAVDDTMLAPVLEPAVAAVRRVGKARKRGARALRRRLATRRRARDDLCVLAMRFTGDPAVPGERFAASARGVRRPVHRGRDREPQGRNPHDIPKSAHSVVTEHLVDEPGHPTKDALDQVLAFFRNASTPNSLPRRHRLVCCQPPLVCTEAAWRVGPCRTRQLRQTKQPTRCGCGTRRRPRSRRTPGARPRAARALRCRADATAKPIARDVDDDRFAPRSRRARSRVVVALRPTAKCRRSSGAATPTRIARYARSSPPLATGDVVHHRHR